MAGGGVTETSQINTIWVISQVGASNSERTGVVSGNTGGSLEGLKQSNLFRSTFGIMLSARLLRPRAEHRCEGRVTTYTGGLKETSGFSESSSAHKHVMSNSH